MKNFVRTSSKACSWITLICFLGPFFTPYAAFAELATPTAGSSSAPASTEDAYCNDICPSLANSNGTILGLNETSAWSTSDDQWCANHGAQTNPNVMPSSAPLGSTVPTESCPGVTYYPGDTSCAQVTSDMTHCQYHNSQVESYCSAYEAAKMAGAGEDMVLTLDIAAAGTCGAVCAMEMTSIGASGTVQKVCDGAAIGAGAAEVLVTLTQQSSAMGKIADAALGAAGIAEGALAWKNASSNSGCANSGNTKNATGTTGAGSGSLTQQVNNINQINGMPAPQAAPLNMPVSAPALPAPAAPVINVDPNPIPAILRPGSKNEYKAPSRLPSVDEFLATLFISNAEAAPQKGCEKAACITAVTMAALAGIRYYNMGYGARTKAKACSNIWSLQSSAAAVAGGVTAAGYTASGGSVGTVSSGRSSSGTTAGTPSTTAATSCVASGGTIASCSNGQISAATDGGILGNSGLGQVSAPLATQLAQASPAPGSGVGGAMGGAMGGAGDFGNVLTKVADTAAQNGKELAQVASMGTSGGGGGGGSASDAGTGLGNLFSGGTAAAPAPVQVFKGEGNESNDIYHSHTDKNIFQIISSRIGKTTPLQNF